MAIWAKHVHYTKYLFEMLTEPFEDRVEYIRHHKPRHEVYLRLRLFAIVPEERIPLPVRQAREFIDQVTESASRLWREGHEAGWPNELKKRHGEAVQVHLSSCDAYDRVVQDFREELEKVHAELCPNCPWDGKTIFPKN